MLNEGCHCQEANGRKEKGGELGACVAQDLEMRRSGKAFCMVSCGSPEVSEGEKPAWGRAKERKRDAPLFCLLFKVS